MHPPTPGSFGVGGYAFFKRFAAAKNVSSVVRVDFPIPACQCLGETICQIEKERIRGCKVSLCSEIQKKVHLIEEK